ncbi:uncharacterized protein LOC135674713 [Musa acuminata AAA Group]|uniref:uncharacterized protein LOC135586242 n=1 Tax=Musa acuminata AAA Group TaxID=214697 RepID=UPI0031DC089F
MLSQPNLFDLRFTASRCTLSSSDPIRMHDGIGWISRSNRMLSWGLFFGKASSPRKLAEFDESSVDHASSTQVKGGDLIAFFCMVRKAKIANHARKGVQCFFPGKKEMVDAPPIYIRNFNQMIKLYDVITSMIITCHPRPRLASTCPPRQWYHPTSPIDGDGDMDT